MIRIKCSGCKKAKWAQPKDNMLSLAQHICKPCRKKRGDKDPKRKPRFKRGIKIPKIKVAEESKKKKKRD